MEEQKTKICKVCKIDKPIEAFSPNQYGKDNRILRRPICKECYSKKVKINNEERRLYELNNPRPKIGESFTCPICQKKIYQRA